MGNLLPLTNYCHGIELKYNCVAFVWENIFLHQSERCYCIFINSPTDGPLTLFLFLETNNKKSLCAQKPGVSKVWCFLNSLHWGFCFTLPKSTHEKTGRNKQIETCCDWWCPLNLWVAQNSFVQQGDSCFKCFQNCSPWRLTCGNPSYVEAYIIRLKLITAVSKLQKKIIKCSVFGQDDGCSHSH